MAHMIGLVLVATAFVLAAPAHAQTLFADGLVLENYAPEIQLRGENGKWLIGMDSANSVPARDFAIARIMRDGPCECVDDFMYFQHNGDTKGATLGLNWTPPPDNYTLNVGSFGEVGGIAVRAPYSHVTGHPFAIVGGNMQDRWHIDRDMWMSHTKIKSMWDYSPFLTFGGDGKDAYGFVYHGDTLVLRELATGRHVMRILNGEIWTNDPRVPSLETRVDDLTRTLEGERAAREAERATTDANLAEQQERIEKLESRATAQQELIGKLESRASEQQELIGKLESRTGSLEEQLAQQDERIDSLASQLALLQQDASTRYSTLDARQRKLGRCVALRNVERRVACARTWLRSQS